MGCLMLWLIFCCISFILYLMFDYTRGDGIETGMSILATGIIPFGIGMLISAWYNKVKHREEVEAKERERQQQIEAMEKERQQKNSECYKNLVTLCDKAISHFESMPGYLRSAEKYLDKAETDFKDSAFAPFWDSVENAVKAIGEYYNCINTIKSNAFEYTNFVKQYEGNHPVFPLSSQSIEKMSVGTDTAKRMEYIVRKAQRNFQFAMIFEQRKTNKILVAGFNNLAGALRDMTDTIIMAIDNLTSSLSGTLERVMNHMSNQVDLRYGNKTKILCE